MRFQRLFPMALAVAAAACADVPTGPPSAGDGAAPSLAATGSANRPPVASLANVNANLLRYEGTHYFFDGTKSSDPDGDRLTYEWSWGDRTPNSTGPKPQHLYVQNGTYKITLTVRDGRGGSSVATKFVKVTNFIPFVNTPVVKGLLPGNVLTGRTVDVSTLFFDRGSKDGAWRWTVNWGDGTTKASGWATARHDRHRGWYGTFAAKHTYQAAGLYKVTACAQDNFGAIGCNSLWVRLK